jgi:YVTN family beta-propeller protein
VRSMQLLISVFIAVSAIGLASTAVAQSSFVAWESGPVRPVALSPDGSRLFVANTPDNTLEVLDVAGGTVTLVDSIPVGMEPVAVAARNNNEVWVVNHLSDSVSVVDLSLTPARVVRTLLVGDEPQDIVFGGSGGNRAFISTARRGQHREDPSIAGVTGAGDPLLTTQGVGRADVWVFDATSLGNTLGGTPVEILSFFADSPRALAVSPDGNTVYVAAFKSGNRTTAIGETIVCDGFQLSGGSGCGAGAPGGVPGPNDNVGGSLAPETGVIVKFDGSDWRDAVGRSWNAAVPFDLPDHDVFAFNANTLASGTVFDKVGTILFNMVVNPVSGRLYVTNTELPNEVRFEGPGDHGGSTVQGRLSLSRVSVLNTGNGNVDPQHLNQHINYSELFTDLNPGNHPDPAKIGQSLATPLQPVVSSDGSTVYMAAFGSSKIGVFDASDLEDASFEANFDPAVASASYIDVGGGPAGLALDEANNRLYVLTRFANQVEVVSLASGLVIDIVSLHDVEPADLVAGRPFLYDATITSGNGEASCSSCHIFGDKDELAWNLGDPDGGVGTNNQPNPSAQGVLDPDPTFHPMKGPMTTQTLKGLSTHGAMHWRGDRADGFFGTDPCTEPAGAACDEDRAFRNFIVAFEGLVGKDGTVSGVEMQAFADFMLQVQLPPNPVRALDNSLSAAASNGDNTFFNTNGTDIVETCNGCHTLDPSSGFFSTGGGATFEGEPQSMKVPHMRNMYTKIGMFNVAGDQIRGFGFLHDGTVATVKNFLESPLFQTGDAEELELEAMALEFSTDFAPIVGQQVTMTTSNGTATEPRADLMEQRAGINYNSLIAGGNVPECEMIAKAANGGDRIGYWRFQDNNFRDDTNNTVSFNALKSLATDANPITFSCVPPGSGERLGINRDEDVVLDGLDNCPGAPNDDQLDTDLDGIGDACDATPAGADSDLDGIVDGIDNCIDDPNPLQEDNDEDGQGDVCDDDDDNDGLLDIVETNTGTFVSPSDTGSDPFNADSDGDGLDDGTEVSFGLDPNTANVSAVPLAPVVPLLLAALMAATGLRSIRRAR